MPVLLAIILLAACSDASPPTPTRGPSAVTGSPAATAGARFGQSLDKVDEVFVQFLTILQTQGVDAARRFAVDQGLITTLDEVRLTLVLDSGDPAIADSTAIAVSRLGGRVTATFGDQIEIVVPMQALADYAKRANRASLFQDLADFQHVRDIRRTPLAQAILTPTPRAPTATGVTGAISEGVALTHADRWQAAGITGKGVKIGIIDVGFNRYAQMLTGTKVTTRAFNNGGKGPLEDAETDDENIHGSACAEIVHEMAPDAELYLARIDTAGSFVDAVNWLVKEIGVPIISASVGIVGFSPVDGTNKQSQAVDSAKQAGVFFAVAAGNSASGEIGSDSGEGHYGATFADTDKDGFNDFPGAKSANGLLVRVNRDRSIRIILNWDDWKQPHVNYDLYLYDSKGAEVAHSTEDQTRGKDPVEAIFGTVKAGTYTLKIRKTNPADPDLPFNIYFRSVQLERSTAEGSLGIPADARGAVTVAALDVRSDTLEPFSSQGATLDGRKKPDIGGPDNNRSFAYASVGEARFPGTSAATPHVAGAAALYKQAFPSATPDAIFAFMAERAAKPQGTKSGANITGAGRLDLGAVPSGASTTPAPTRAPAPPDIPPITRTGPFFADDFSATTSGLPAQGYVNGEYRLAQNVTTSRAVTYPQGINAPQATYAVQTRKVSGDDDNAMGLVVGYRDAGTFTLFLVASDGTFGILEKRNGSYQTLQPWTPHASVAKGTATNALRVEITGTRAVFRVNGAQVAAIDLAQPPIGKFGLMAGAGRGGPTEAAFDNLAVTLG